MGAGTCEQLVPQVFQERGDGVWVVKEDGEVFGVTITFDGGDGPAHGPDGAGGIARVPHALADWVVEAAEECPAECIYVEA
jgi:ferredoxin